MPPIGSAARWLMRGLGGAGGAAYGASTAEPDEDPLLRGLAGAATGGIVGPAGVSALARTGWKAKDIPAKLSDYTFFSLLSSPDTMVRGGAGALGGAVVAGLELLAEGAVTGNLKKLKNAGGIFKSLVTEAPLTWGKALGASDQEFAKMQRQFLYEPGKSAYGDVAQYTGGQGIGKWFSAADMAGIQAMERGGLSRAAAKRYTLTGDPETRLGKSTLGHLQSFKGKGGWEEVLGTQVSPFARVGVMGLEQGLQRMPLIGMLPMINPKTTSLATRAARQIPGAIGMGAGYAAEDAGVDPRTTMLLGPLAGPAFAPLVYGRELRRQRERGKDLGTTGPWITAGSETFKESSPLGFNPLSIVSSFRTEVPRRVIPSGMADIARALDPAWERERGEARLEELKNQGLFEGDPSAGVWKARIPGLRETLPETFAPVDAFGRPKYDTPEIIAGAENNPALRGMLRTLAPAFQTSEPAAMPQSDPTMAALRELGLELRSPSARTTLPQRLGSALGGLPLQHTAESAASVQSMRGIPREIAAPIVIQVMNNPRFAHLSPWQKRRMATRLMEQIQGRLSRLLSNARLTTALSQGATVPPQFL
jgi:hypothetical protein